MRRLLLLTFSFALIATAAVAQDGPIMAPPQRTPPQVIPRTPENKAEILIGKMAKAVVESWSGGKVSTGGEVAPKN